MAEMATKSLPVPYQKHLLGGCTTDVPLLNCHLQVAYHFAACLHDTMLLLLLPPPKKEVMFLVRSVCLFVCLSVGLLANL